MSKKVMGRWSPVSCPKLLLSHASGDNGTSHAAADVWDARGRRNERPGSASASLCALQNGIGASFAAALKVVQCDEPFDTLVG